MFGLRRRRPPAALRPRVGRDERFVAWARSADDATAAVVVTTLGVFLPGRAERLGWHHIHKATWSDSRLTVVPSVKVADRDGYTVMADDAQVVVSITDPGDVPGAIRDRVTRSVVHTEHHPLPGGGVRVVARHVPGSDGLVRHVRYDTGTDIDDPEIVAATEGLVAGIADDGESG